VILSGGRNDSSGFCGSTFIISVLVLDFHPTLSFLLVFSASNLLAGALHGCPLCNDSPFLLVCSALNLLGGALQGCSLLIPPGPLSWYTPLGACPELVSPPRLMWSSSSRGSTFLRLEKGGIPDPAPLPPPNWGCGGPLGWLLGGKWWLPSLSPPNLFGRLSSFAVGVSYMYLLAAVRLSAKW
jgi:hypothetical protein